MGDQRATCTRDQRAIYTRDQRASYIRDQRATFLFIGVVLVTHITHVRSMRKKNIFATKKHPLT